MSTRSRLTIAVLMVVVVAGGLYFFRVLSENESLPSLVSPLSSKVGEQSSTKDATNTSYLTIQTDEQVAFELIDPNGAVVTDNTTLYRLEEPIANIVDEKLSDYQPTWVLEYPNPAEGSYALTLTPSKSGLFSVFFSYLDRYEGDLTIEKEFSLQMGKPHTLRFSLDPNNAESTVFY